MNLVKISNQTIKYCFLVLFFFLPLLLTPWNYELFEFNKMILVYALTTIILGAWLIKIVHEGEIRIQRTPLDLPILVYFITQLLSTIFSIDPHVSLWGYYSRFHGGLLSIICYIILYYGFVSNLTFAPPTLTRLFLLILASATLVSFYGILEHFGIDKDLWVQDVQNRVFSTLGQPNWLAAYLCIVLPITIAFYLSPCLISQKKERGRPRYSFLYLLLASLFYLCLLYTRSRSGFLAFWLTNAMFAFLTIITTTSIATISLSSKKQELRKHSPIGTKIHIPNQFFQPRKIWRKLAILNLLFLLITFFTGSPFAQINRYFSFSSLSQKLTKKAPPPPPKPIGPALQAGGTESGEIRKIVWKGAVEIARHYPLFGTGVETFAFAYYLFRPKEHNLTSEWDFLYNKAHNEYLNYAATTGLLGLGAYLFLIGSFLWWNVKKVKSLLRKAPSKRTIQNSKLSTLNFNFAFCILHFALLAGYASILITNFFGFSVVVIAFFFWLLPALSFTLSGHLKPEKLIIRLPTIKTLKSLSTLAILFFIFYFLFFIAKLWYADTLFAQGNSLLAQGQYSSAYSFLKKATSLSPHEPLYASKFSLSLAYLATAAFLENQATLSAQLENQALFFSQKALKVSPQNINFWKNQTRVFYILSQIKREYLYRAQETLKVAQKLAPTDAKILYNLALLEAEIGEEEKAIKTLEKTIALKPNYRHARFALALFYQEKGLEERAREQLKYILEKINPNDEEAKKQLEEWKN